MFKRSPNTCAGDVRGILLCSKGCKTRVRELCGETCCVQKVATNVCGKCAGNLVVFKRLQNTCAGNVPGQTWGTPRFPIVSFLATMPAVL